MQRCMRLLAFFTGVEGLFWFKALAVLMLSARFLEHGCS